MCIFLCLGILQGLHLAELCLSLPCSAPAFPTYSTELCGNDKPNNTTKMCAIACPLWTTGCARAALGADSPDWPQFINCSFKKWLKIPAEGLRNTPENGSTSWPCGQQGVCFLHVCFQGLLVTSQNEQNLKTFGLPSLKISCSKALLGLLPPLDLGYHPDGLKCSCSEKTRWQWHIQ